MSKKSVVDHYELEWKKRIDENGNESFFNYERNWVLPPLFKSNEEVLDLGSGNSIVGEYLVKKFNCRVTALDFSKIAIEVAKKKGVKGIVGSVEDNLPFKNGYFDLVFWGDNIEHVWQPKLILKEIYRVLKSKGRVIISTPNQAYWRYRLHSLLKGELPKTEGTPNQPWEWTHIRFFNRNILNKLLKLCGFKEINFLGVSRRRLDRVLLKIFPDIFGMIMIVEAKKK